MSKISNLYAMSLFDVCLDDGKVDEVFLDFELVLKVFKENEDYIKLLNSYAIEKKEKEKLIDEAFKENINEYTLNFLKLLSTKNIMNTFFDCEKTFRKKYYEYKGIENVNVITAIKISEESKEKLKQKLEKITGKKVVINLSVDEGILGGMIIRFANSIVDASVKSKLEDIKKHIFS